MNLSEIPKKCRQIVRERENPRTYEPKMLRKTGNTCQQLSKQNKYTFDVAPVSDDNSSILNTYIQPDFRMLNNQYGTI